jgi:hypothetical protein
LNCAAQAVRYANWLNMSMSLRPPNDARTAVSEPRLQVEYCLTAFGTSLAPVLNEMATWPKRHHRRFGARLAATK